MPQPWIPKSSPWAAQQQVVPADVNRWEAGITKGTRTGVGTDFREWGAAVPNADASAVLQTAIDDRYANENSSPIIVPALDGLTDYWLANVTIKPDVAIIGEGWRSRLKANPASSTPVIGSIKQTGLVKGPGWAPQDPSRNQIRNLSLWGNSAAGATGRAIELVNSNNDDRFDTWEKPMQEGNGWFDLSHILSDLFILDFASDYAVLLGQNMKGTWFDRSFIFACKGGGMLVDCTDSQFSNLQVGGCGEGIRVRNYNNMFSNSKSWYHYGSETPGFTGSGSGWVLTYDTTDKPMGGGSLTQMTGCQTQDNYNYGVWMHGVEGCQIAGHMAGGDEDASIMLSGPATNNVIRFKVIKADRVQTNALVLTDGSGVVDNDIEVSDSDTGNIDKRSRGTTFACVKHTGAGDLGYNSFRWAGGNRRGFLQTTGAGQTVTPDAKDGYITVYGAGGGSTTIAAPDNALPGLEITLTYTQNGTGTGTVVWNSVYSSGGPTPPQPSTGSFAYTSYRFVNVSNNGAAPIWRLINQPVGGGAATNYKTLADVDTTKTWHTGESTVYDETTAKFVPGSGVLAWDALISYESGTLGYSATYVAYDGNGRFVGRYTDNTTTGVSGLRAAEDAVKGPGVFIKYGRGHFRYLEAPTGNEAWAAGNDHGDFTDCQGMQFEGCGEEQTFKESRTNSGFTNSVGHATTDVEMFSFTRGERIKIREMTCDGAGYIKSSTDVVDLDQGTNCALTNLRSRASRARAFVFDGGDNGKYSGRNRVAHVRVYGRSPQPQLNIQGTGTLVNATTHKYAVTWRCKDLVQRQVSSVSWAAGVLTVNTTAPHGYEPGDPISLSVARASMPSAMNMGDKIIATAAAGSSTFTIPVAADPGALPAGTTWVLGPGDTRPSRTTEVVTSAANQAVVATLDTAPFHCIKRRLHRWTAAGGWKFIAETTANPFQQVNLTDNGASTTASVFTYYSTVFGSGIEFLGSSDNILIDAVVDGVGHSDFSTGFGVNCVRKVSGATTEDSHRNTILGLRAYGCLREGFRTFHGNDNAIGGGSYIEDSGSATKTAGIRIDGTSARTGITETTIVDDGTSANGSWALLAGAPHDHTMSQGVNIVSTAVDTSLDNVTVQITSASGTNPVLDAGTRTRYGILIGVPTSATPTAAYTVKTYEDVVMGGGAASYALTLPDATLATKAVFVGMALGASGTKTITPFGAQTIGGALTVALTVPGSGRRLVPDNATGTWRVESVV